MWRWHAMGAQHVKAAASKVFIDSKHKTNDEVELSPLFLIHVAEVVLHFYGPDKNEAWKETRR